MLTTAHIRPRVIAVTGPLPISLGKFGAAPRQPVDGQPSVGAEAGPWYLQQRQTPSQLRARQHPDLQALPCQLTAGKDSVADLFADFVLHTR